MKFNKRKFNIIIVFTLLLICFTVVFSSVDFKGIINNPNAEEEDPFPDDYNPVDPDVPSGSLDEMTELNKPFVKAWTAYYYAMEMNKKYSNYMTYSQKVHGKADSYPVTVDVNTNRKIFNNVSEVYVINEAKTIIDVANLGIDVGNGQNFVSYTCFDLVNGRVIKENNDNESLDAYISRKLVVTYELPYIINDKTASASLKNDPNKSYYEIYMTLNSSAWKDYATVLREEVGSSQKPNINSISLVIKIDKQYGFFVSVEAKENYSIVYEYGSIKANVTCTGEIVLKYNYKVNLQSAIKDVQDKIGM